MLANMPFPTKIEGSNLFCLCPPYKCQHGSIWQYSILDLVFELAPAACNTHQFKQILSNPGWFLMHWPSFSHLLRSLSTSIHIHTTATFFCPNSKCQQAAHTQIRVGYGAVWMVSRVVFNFESNELLNISDNRKMFFCRCTFTFSFKI